MRRHGVEVERARRGWRIEEMPLDGRVKRRNIVNFDGGMVSFKIVTSLFKFKVVYEMLVVDMKLTVKADKAVGAPCGRRQQQ